MKHTGDLVDDMVGRTATENNSEHELVWMICATGSYQERSIFAWVISTTLNAEQICTRKASRGKPAAH